MAIVTLVLVLSLLFALGLYYRTKPELNHRQKIGLIIIRSITVFLVLIFLLTPVIYYIRKYSEHPVIILLKDTSTSMQLNQQGQTKASKINQAFNMLRTAYKEAGYSIKQQVFADGLNGKSNTTFLIPALQKIKETNVNTPVKQIIVFSDGWFRDTDLQALKNFDVPISTISDTAHIQAVDIQVSDFKHNQQGYRNELSLFEPTLKSSGYRGQAKVSFLVNDKIVKEKSINFKDELIQTVSFDYRFTQLGLQKVETSITANGIREQMLTNNISSSAIDILNDKERILLLTDIPNWDIKFMLDTIRENNRLDPLSYTFKGNDLYSGEQKTNLKNWENITAILIVNQGSLQLSSYLYTNIIGKVRQGCGLLYMGMPLNTLNEVLPLHAANIRSSYTGLIKLVPAAGSHSAFRISDYELSLIPPVDYYYLVPSHGAEILAVLDNVQKSPAIAILSSPNGKVASFSFLNLWRWQMQSKSQGYHAFFLDVLTWLSNKSTGQLNALYEPSYYLDEPIEIKLNAVDEIHKVNQNLAPRITVYNSKNISIFTDFLVRDQDAYSIKFRLAKPDVYHFTIIDRGSGKSTIGRFLVLTQNLEARDWGYNNQLLNWLAVQTGGKHLSLSDVSTFRPLKAFTVPRIEKKSYSLFKQWYILLLFILFFCLELYLRRRWGLL